jgi:hypothetical protein
MSPTGPSGRQLVKQRLVVIVFIVAVVALGWLEVREQREQAEKQRAFSVVSELGGKIGSLTPPLPYSGSEYRIEFGRKSFSREQLGRLLVLNELTGRNRVGIGFEETNLTAEDVRWLRGLMPKCWIFRVVKGEHLRDD